MKLKWTKSSYKSAENYLGKGEKEPYTGETTSAKTMGRGLGAITDTTTGQQIYFLTLMALFSS